MRTPVPPPTPSAGKVSLSSADPWLELSIRTDLETAESVSQVLNSLNANRAIIEQVVPGPSGSPSSEATVKTFLPPDDTATRQRIEEALWHLGQIREISPIEARVLKPEEWAEAWKRDYSVQHIGKRFVVVPSWIEYSPRSDEIVINLDPGLAFGTGLHPSTRLALRALERIWAGSMVVLDVGTGSGILSIAAARMDAPYVLAIDIDRVAVRVAQENVELNGVAGQVRIRAGSVRVDSEGLHVDGPMTDSSAATRRALSEGFFDLVLANIIAEVIVELAHPLSAVLQPGALLIASGIIRDRVSTVEAALSAVDIRIMDHLEDDDWVALIGKKGES